MGLVVCKTCKRAFIDAQGEEFCPECMARLKAIYPTVRNFLRNHDKNFYTARDVSKILGVELRDVEGLVTLGLIHSQPSREQAPQRTANSVDLQKEKARPGRKKNSVYHKNRK